MKHEFAWHQRAKLSMQWLVVVPLCNLIVLNIGRPPAYAVVTAFHHLSQQNQALHSSLKHPQHTFSLHPKQVSAETPQDSPCPAPVLSRLEQHQVAAGETLESIAAQYGLIPATLIGFNPELAEGQVSPGMQLRVPPFNGIRVNVPPGSTWQDLAEQYNVRADVLFEANGCGDVPSVAFIPGINWAPDRGTVALQQRSQELDGFPLPAIAPVLRQYGWQTEPGTVDIEFHSGVDIDAVEGTPVLSVGSGVVAFAGEQGSYGNLVVINHQQGLQTRYAQLASISVAQGDNIRAGQPIGTSGATGDVYAPHLHFEIRENSNLGWVAQDPAHYLDNMRMFDQ